MPTKVHPKRNEIILAALEEYKDRPTRTIARILYDKYPMIFANVEACRTALRQKRGNAGKAHKGCIDERYERPNGKSGEVYEMPKSIADPNKPFKMPKGMTAIFNDWHIPYHDNVAARVMLEYIKPLPLDAVYLNGDMIDFLAASDWCKDPRDVDLQRELQDARQFLCILRQMFPKARIIYKIGNHEDRWERYLFKKAPELLGVTDFEMRKLLRFNDYGVEEVLSKQICKAGKHLTIIHGHEIFGAMAPVNFARTLQMKLGECAIAGHRHTTSEHAFKTVSGKNIMCWSVGCGCEMHPEYAPINGWNHGFGILELKGDDFHFDNKRIVNGMVY